MGGAGGNRVVRRAARALLGAGLGAGLAVALAACGDADAQPTAVPTFEAPASAAGAAGPADDGRVVPADCGRILGAPDLEALLGLPLGSVAVRTTIGVPQPAVGRTERVSCRYTRIGDGGGRALLDLNASAYRDAAAASSQWRVNADAESGERRDVPLGAASAALFEKRGQAALMVAHSTSNVTLVLPDQPLPGGRSRADVLVDMALRVLPAVSVEPTTTPPPPPTGPLPQAGAVPSLGG